MTVVITQQSVSVRSVITIYFTSRSSLLADRTNGHVYATLLCPSVVCL